MSHPKTTPPPFSLFKLIRQQLNQDTPVVRCSKATLVQLSHTLEDLVLNRGIPALFFLGLQEHSQWRQERERYQKLAQVAQQVWVFSSPSVPSADESNFIQITLNPDDPLRQDWFLMILSEPLALVLCAENSGMETANEATRQFDMIWSFEPGLVNHALDFLEEIITVYRPEHLVSLQTMRANYSVINPNPALISNLMMQMVRLEETLHQRFREAEGILQRYQSRLEAQVTQRTSDLLAANQQLQQEVAERHEANEELRRYRHHLEDLIVERTAELSAANQKLQQEIMERQRIEAEREHLLVAERDQRLLAETMQEVTLALISQMNLETILHEILRQAQRLVSHNTASITLLEGEILRVVCWQGYEAFNCETFVAHLYQPLADLPLERTAIANRAALVIHDTQQEPAWVRYAETDWIKSTLGIPICLQDQVLGLLRLDSNTPGQFSTKDAQRLQTLANTAAIALENARLYTRTQKLYQQTQKQAEQLEQILNAVQAGIILLDDEYRIKVINSTAQMCLPALTHVDIGQPCTHLGGRPLSEFLTAPPPGGYYEVTPEGESRPIFEVKIRPVIAPPETEGWVLVVRDITDQRDIQKRAQEQEKLAAVGQLAAGIAHDFNNILTSIIGFAELARYEPDVPVSVQTDLSHVVQQGKRAAHLVRQILDFARKNITAKRPLEFNGFLADVVRLLERTIPESIRLELEIEPAQETFTLNADATQLQQVLTNLAVNAADAMPAGGLLKFRLSRFTLRSGQWPPCPGLSPGDWLVLAVMDTGTGISAKDLPHIFEPFFTTKEVGQGTGLGLAQVDGIIKQHDGCISVESKVGKGTTFTLYLPLFQAKRSSLSEVNPRTKFSGRGETLLLVEDDPAVLEVTQAMLKGLGYQVLPASNGLVALDIYDRHRDQIAVVITDLTMPNMGGLALSEALQAKNREIKILAMTGYPLKIGTGVLRASGISGWLQKPLSLEQLAKKLDQVLKM